MSQPSEVRVICQPSPNLPIEAAMNSLRLCGEHTPGYVPGRLILRSTLDYAPAKLQDLKEANFQTPKRKCDSDSGDDNPAGTKRASPS